MFKRIMLTLTFAAAFGAAGLYMADNADARWGRRGGWNGGYSSYNSYNYGPRAAYGYGGYGYGYGVPYRANYNGYYGPRAYGYSYYNDPGYYYYGRPRVAVGVGPVWR